MKQTKLIYPGYFGQIFQKGTEDIDFKKMRELNYPEKALKFFEKHFYGSGYTEPLDDTINRWLEKNEDKISVVDIKYSGYADENSNVSALIIYEI